MGQQPILKRLPVSADCKNAIQLSAARKLSYGPTVPPKGFGKIKDISSGTKKNIFSFEKEHNTAWYAFTAQENGDLVFEINSINPRDDYDFMLFKWTDSCSCDDIKYKSIPAIRSNLSHTESTQGVPMTGLSAQASADNIPLGVGDELSTSLPVKKGEKFYLAIDNVHPKGEGHTIEIYYLKEITVIGSVIDENKQPVASANVQVENMSGKMVNQTQCDSEGRYWLSAKIKDDEFYSLIYSSDSSFITCRQIVFNEFAKFNYIQKDIKTTLPKLVRGKKYILDGISYNSKTGRLHTASYPTLNALAKLMLKYKGLKVQIEGHVNNPAMGSNSGADKVLGQSRSNEIYDYLLNKGIANTRIVPTSFGSLYMIHPKPSSPIEIEQNNRIEIFFLPDK